MDKNKEFPQLFIPDIHEEILYFDNAATPPVPHSILKHYSSFLTREMLGNPHSTASPSAQNTSKIVEKMRMKILNHFDVNGDEYTVVFTSSATAALKDLSYMLNFQKDSFDRNQAISSLRPEVWMLDSNHTSVVGMSSVLESRHTELIISSKTCKEIDSFLRNPFPKTRVAFFAYPAQCNFTGRRYPLGEWIKPFQSRNSLVLLDVSSFLSTTKLSLKDPNCKPDFLVFSFYKLFGFPTGLGCLLIKNSSISYLEKLYVGGGSVDSIAISPYYKSFARSFSKRFEDGTLPFQQIAALEYGFQFIEEYMGGWMSYSKYCLDLIDQLRKRMKSLKHPNNAPLVIIYDRLSDTNDYTLLFENDEASKGPIIAFNLQRMDGSFIGYTEVTRLAFSENIHLRAGRFCNPGAAQLQLGLESKQVQELHNVLGHVCGDAYDLIAERKPTGALRISIGFANHQNDLERLLDFLKHYFSSPPIIPKSNYIMNGFSAVDLYIYPIKSCRSFRIDRSWPLVPSSGFLYDRQYMLVDLEGNPLTQKRIPRMNLIAIVSLDIKSRQMIIRAPGMTDLTISLNDESTLTDYKRIESSLCGLVIETKSKRNDLNIHEWFTTFLDHECRFVEKASHQKSFSNSSQYLLISNPSVQELKRLIPSNEPKDHISALSFRPNIVISNLEPFVENEWKKGDVIEIFEGIFFKVEGFCERCNMVNLDDQARRFKEPLRTLARLPRIDKKIEFGVYLGLDHLGSVSLEKESSQLN